MDVPHTCQGMVYSDNACFLTGSSTSHSLFLLMPLIVPCLTHLV